MVRLSLLIDTQKHTFIPVYLGLCVCVCDYIQVEALTGTEVVEGPIYVTINVLDINNNAPYFEQSVYTAVIREHSPAGEYLNERGERFRYRFNVILCIQLRQQYWQHMSDCNGDMVCYFCSTEWFSTLPGVPFIRVNALDRDDPKSPNAQLNYSLVSQIPNKHNVPLFQIDSHTGEISVTAEGNTTRACADSSQDIVEPNQGHWPGGSL